MCSSPKNTLRSTSSTYCFSPSLQNQMHSLHSWLPGKNKCRSLPSLMTSHAQSTLPTHHPLSCFSMYGITQGSVLGLVLVSFFLSSVNQFTHCRSKYSLQVFTSLLYFISHEHVLFGLLSFSCYYKYLVENYCYK